MEKKSIHIKRIRESSLIHKEDEVAVEALVDITLRDGRKLQIACTPTYIEEMVLGRRFLLGDLEEGELEIYSESSGAEKVHETEMSFDTVALNEIFCIAADTFERPGTLFYDTGCAHCCALVQNGQVLCCIEDIGRHNALDKVVGYALKHGISKERSYLYTSGRISGDYLQKVIKAGFPMVVSRAAVTSAAVSLAKEKDITMLGFVRKRSGNVYHLGKIHVMQEKDTKD